MENFQYDQDPGFSKPEFNLDCQHEKFTKEIYMGQRTGDYVCTGCDLVLPANEHKKLMEKRASEKS